MAWNDGANVKSAVDKANKSAEESSDKMLQLGKRMERLTWAILGLTVVMLILAVVQIVIAIEKEGKKKKRRGRTLVFVFS